MPGLHSEILSKKEEGEEVLEEGQEEEEEEGEHTTFTYPTNTVRHPSHLMGWAYTCEQLR